MNYRELRHALKGKLGASENRESHHIYYYLSVSGIDHCIGKLSHSARGHDEVQEYVVSDTARRLRLDKREFLQFVDCTIGKEDHAKLWHKRATPGI